MAAQRETAVIEGKAYWSKLNKKDEYSDKMRVVKIIKDKYDSSGYTK